MRTCRFSLLSNVIEVRDTDFGTHRVLVSGRPISRRWLGSVFGSTHHFALGDSGERQHHVEVRVRASGMRQTRGLVVVDGTVEMPLLLRSESQPRGLCAGCGYDLRGCSPDKEERVRCPECGRAHYASEAGLVFRIDRADA